MPKFRFRMNDVNHSEIKTIKKRLEEFGAIQISFGTTKLKETYILFSLKSIKVILEVKAKYSNIKEVLQ
jgi:hypothetical protein